GPPLVIVHGWRRNCQTPANSVAGWSGTRARSDTPLDGPRYSVRAQCAPPSCVTNAPRVVPSRNTCPSTPTTTVRGSRGSSEIAAIEPASSSPAWRHVFPPSTECQMPAPSSTVLRGFASPVPAHTSLGSRGDTASAPIGATRSRSNVGRHDTPPSELLNTPPPAPPA